MSDSEQNAAALSVPLPRRARSENGTAPPVWPLAQSVDTISIPLQAKCAREDRSDGVCCKELKDDDDRTLIDPDVVRDV